MSTFLSNRSGERDEVDLISRWSLRTRGDHVGSQPPAGAPAASPILISGSFCRTVVNITKDRTQGLVSKCAQCMVAATCWPGTKQPQRHVSLSSPTSLCRGLGSLLINA